MARSRLATLLPVGLVVGIVVGLTSGACRAEPAARKSIVVWQPLANWTGRASIQTESFISTSGMFRIDWQSRVLTPDASAVDPGSLRVTLHSAVSGRPLVVALDHRGPGKDVAYVTEDPREFYLEVEATGVEWTLALLEGVRATAPVRD